MSLNWHQHTSSQTVAAVICSKHSHHHTSHVHHTIIPPASAALVIPFIHWRFFKSFHTTRPPIVFCDHLPILPSSGLGKKLGCYAMLASHHLFLSNTGSRDAGAVRDHPQPHVPCPAEHLHVSNSLAALFSLKVLHSEVLRYTETGNSLSTFTLM